VTLVLPIPRVACHDCGVMRQVAVSFAEPRYRYPITTGPLEGTNNKIKTMKLQAYGFRDQEFLKLKILALHESKYALVG
jgi:transposase